MSGSTPSKPIDPNLLSTIRRDIIGEGIQIATPFGRKPLVYADYTASGRSLQSIENFIQKNVLPFYANTHSDSSFCGRQTTAYREQARELIRKELNADENWAIIFCGSGATAAINKFIDILGLRLPLTKFQRQLLAENSTDKERAVVFISPYEHHSNELPWRESNVDLVCITLDQNDQLDLIALENSLKTYQHRTLKIASFSAASNVTGIRSNVDAITRLLHRYETLACWDYAAAGPYVDIHLKNTAGSADNSIDAIFLSPHKFIGGPGTPGILAIKRELLNSEQTPSLPGGGTVSWVSPRHHYYLPAGERREEGGTPAIIEAIRAGLVFKLKKTIGAKAIEQREKQHIRYAINRLKKHPHISILGNTDVERLAILSLQIRLTDKNGVMRELHHGLIVVLLNDLFGIQARGGCSCAGPYGHYLLGIDEEKSARFEELIKHGEMIFRPGWVRINFNYFIDDKTADYLLSALELIATYGWKLLGYYHWDRQSNVWKHRIEQQPPLHHLDDFFPEENITNPGIAADQAALLQENLQKMSDFLIALQPKPNTLPLTKAAHENWRWFACADDFL